MENVTFSGIGGIITLRVPEFADSESLELTRINRTSRGNELLIFRDPIWPKIIILKMKFTYLSRIQCDKLRTFSKNNIGRPVIFTDHNSVDWTGIIMNPTIPVTQEGPKNYTAELEFDCAQN